MCKKSYTYEELKDQHYWRGTNKYILRGYRANMTKMQILQSAFSLHNETFNVWTHIVGFFIFFYLMIHSLQTWLSDGSYGERFVFMVWVLAAQFQMLASASFHLLGDYSKVWYETLARLDYTSISVLIVASYFPIIYNIFYCQTVWQYAYLGFMGVAGVSCVAFSWLKMFQAPHLQSLRAGLFIALSFVGLFSIPHALLYHKISFLLPVVSRLALMGVLYISGAMIYVTCVPESLYPGRFDIFCSSHSIWHCFVVAAALAHYFAVYHSHYWKFEQDICS